MRLSELPRRVVTRSVPFRGGTVEMRVVSAWEAMLVRELLPEPSNPPLKPDPARGSLSLAPDENDPEYRRARVSAFARQRAGVLALSLNLTTAGGLTWPASHPDDVGRDADAARAAKRQKQREYLAAAAAEMLADMTEAELYALNSELEGFDLAAAMAEAEKN